MATKLSDYQLAQGIERSVKGIQDYTLDDVANGKVVIDNFGYAKKVLAVITFPGKKLVLFDNPSYREEQGLAVKAFMEWCNQWVNPIKEPLYENCSDDICTGNCNRCPICDD